jgi:hypothetical protein
MKALKFGAFRITTATNYGTLTTCMTVIYLIGHERPSSFCFSVSCLSVLKTDINGRGDPLR